MNNRFNNYVLAEQKVINELSQNNPGAKIIVEKMLNDENLAEYITVCDDLDIRGSKLYLLYSDCCKNNVAENRIGGLKIIHIHKSLKCCFLQFKNSGFTGGIYTAV